MKQEAIILIIGVLIIIAIIGISDVSISGKTILNKANIVRYQGDDVYCNKHECKDFCGKLCSEYKSKYEMACSSKLYYKCE